MDNKVKHIVRENLGSIPNIIHWSRFEGTLNLGIKQFKRDNPDASSAEIKAYKDKQWRKVQS